MESDFCGFCYFNNVALAAKHAVDHLGVQRVLIVDWDVHHGNGTQDAFYHDSRVLYFSIHGYLYGKIFPGLRESDYDYIGEDGGLGYNVNVPLNQLGCSDVDYLFIVHQLLLPLAHEFCPELIIISAGFDSALGDPLGGMAVTPRCYSAITHYLMSLAAGKVVVALEGGYLRPSLAHCASSVLKTLLGDACPRPRIQSLRPESLVVDVVHNVRSLLRPHWQCFSRTARVDDAPLSRSQRLEGATFKVYHENRPEEYDCQVYTYLYERPPPEMEETYEKKLAPMVSREMATASTKLVRYDGVSENSAQSGNQALIRLIEHIVDSRNHNGIVALDGGRPDGGLSSRVVETAIQCVRSKFGAGGKVLILDLGSQLRNGNIDS